MTKAEIPGKPTNTVLTLRVHTDLVAYLDRVRGNATRSRYVRDLIRADHQAHQEAR